MGDGEDAILLAIANDRRCLARFAYSAGNNQSRGLVGSFRSASLPFALCTERLVDLITLKVLAKLLGCNPVGWDQSRREEQAEVERGRQRAGNGKRVSLAIRGSTSVPMTPRYHRSPAVTKPRSSEESRTML